MSGKIELPKRVDYHAVVQIWFAENRSTPIYIMSDHSLRMPLFTKKGAILGWFSRPQLEAQKASDDVLADYDATVAEYTAFVHRKKIIT